ncbi:MAG TPA: sulfatase-like hydrolase/transferase, partial [Gemmatimonadales bacterium]|nr:sulfatase-like hydrolase/transferase [Gemmatimonadales bacterium]
YLLLFDEWSLARSERDGLRHLRYLDLVLGRFLDTLEAAGRLDSALVVVTSDHAWKKDPDRRERVRERLRRVPLLVRWPGVTDGGMRVGGVCLPRLAEAMDAFMAGHPLEAGTRETWCR